MKNNPLITIYITNHNYGKYLEQSINSALVQTYKNIEVIIVDDASRDESKKILKKYKNKKKIKIILNKSQKGLVKSSIIAIKKSKGSYILRLDADDYLKKNAIEKMFNAIRKKKNVGLIFCDFNYVNNKSNLISRFKYKHKKKYSISDYPAHGACSLINKKNYLKVGGYNKLFDRQDGFYIWLLMLLKKYTILHYKKPLFYYRKHGKNLSLDFEKILQTKLKILSFFLKKKRFYNLDLLRLKSIIANKINNLTLQNNKNYKVKLSSYQ